MLSFCQVHILSLPFSNRSIIVIDPYRSLYITFQPECLHVLLVHCSPFLMSFNLQGSRNVPCSSSSKGVFSTSFIFVVFFLSFNLFNLSRFIGFTYLLKKQLCFTSSLPPPFPSGAILDLGTRSARSGGVL